MSKAEVRELLAKLKDEIQDAELDDETRSLMRDLDEEIHGLLDDEDDALAAVVDRAREAEANFESDHPLATRVLQEFVQALARMGI